MIAIAGSDGEERTVDIGAQRSVPGVLPVLPLRETVPLPDTLTPLAVGQERSVRLVNDVLGGDRMLVMVASKNPELDTPGPDDLYRVGVAGVVARMLKVPDGTVRISAETLGYLVSTVRGLVDSQAEMMRLLKEKEAERPPAAPADAVPAGCVSDGAGRQRVGGGARRAEPVQGPGDGACQREQATAG